MWDILRYLVILFSVAFGVCGLFLIPMPFAVYVGFLIALLGASLASYASERSDKWNEPHNLLVKHKISQLISEAESVSREIQAIYDRYRDRPPDWEERRARVIARDDGKCRQCGRRMSGSRVPFHVHHINPSFKEDADHGLSNLMLLCEICHSKMDSRGHHLIKAQRKKRVSKGSLVRDWGQT
jgi:5-methylcytosine-specific restriction endonuclease McrA